MNAQPAKSLLDSRTQHAEFGSPSNIKNGFTVKFKVDLKKFEEERTILEIPNYSQFYCVSTIRSNGDVRFTAKFIQDSTPGIPAGSTYSVSTDGISNFKKSHMIFHPCENPSVYTDPDG